MGPWALDAAGWSPDVRVAHQGHRERPQPATATRGGSAHLCMVRVRLQVRPDRGAGELSIPSCKRSGVSSVLPLGSAVLPSLVNNVSAGDGALCPFQPP